MDNDTFFSIWRVNMRTQTFTREPVPENWEKLGGRALLTRILLDEGVATCEPLGRYNKLVFAPGLLVGHMLSSTDRISIGAKSPLTGGIKEANAGGRTGLQLALLGIKALIIEEQAEEGWWALHVTRAGVSFDRVDELANTGVFTAAPALVERYGEKAAIALIGQGGERKLRGAGIQNLDKDRQPTRIAARGGIGAVMGARRVKAVVIDGTGGEKPPVFDKAAFKTAQKEYTTALMAHPQTATYRDFGTAAIVMMCQSFGCLPTRNFSDGQFEGAEEISGEALRQTMLNRGGECDTSHACMAGCTIRSSNVYGDVNGKALVSPMEYETIGLMGSNLGISNFDHIAQLNWEVNDMGLDSIEIGAALGVAADAGLFAWGDTEGALRLLHEVRNDTPLGRIIGNGAAMTGQVLGIERVPVVKNQAMSAYDPRAIKGTGVTYATSAQGADHTSGLTIRAKVDHTDPNGQVPVSRNAQFNMAGYDSLGACIFAGFGYGSVPQVIPALIKARYGWDVPENYLQVLGKETIRLEREFNRQAGFTAAQDRLPEWMRREALHPTNAVFDVPDEELDSIFDF